MSDGRPKGDPTQPAGVHVPDPVKTNADLAAEAGGQTVVTAPNEPPRPKAKDKKGGE